jgi:soluble cytochrome b562
MDKIATYFSEKIETAASFYKTRARLIDAAYLAQVEKLAKQTDDKVLAEFFRRTMQSDRIVSAVDDIRTLLKEGQIIEADRALERLEKNLEFVESHLRYPFFRTGAKQRKYLDGEAFGEQIVAAIKGYVERKCAALEAKIAVLEAQLEAKNFAYVGAHKDGRTYNVGQFVTYGGALWHCNQFHTRTRPGDGDASWTLAVKAGRDGKDAAHN